MNNFKKFKSGAGQAESFSSLQNQNVGLLEELEKSRGQVKDLSEKLTKTVSELELTVFKAKLEERLRVSNYLVEELQLLNERLESEKSKLASKLTLAHESGLDSRLTASETSGSEVMDTEAGEAMERNHEAREPLPNIFGIPVILRLILEKLPNSNLLKLSFVNKLWKKEARSVMKKRGDVMALLDGFSYYRGCLQVFKDFAANLESLNEPLYSGMTIRLRQPRYDCQGTMALELEGIHESIVNGMRGKLTRLSIELRGVENCWNASDCPNFLLLRLLLRDFIGDLEHLTLEIEDIMEPFIHQYLTPGPYPKLKVLKLEGTYEENFEDQIRMLLSRAPNLQKIHTHTCAWLDLSENLLEGREGVVHVYESTVRDAMEDISEDVIPALRLERINFIYTPEAELNLDRWNEKAQSLLRTCCATTLKSLSLNASSAVLFMSYGIRLLNVKDLTINLLGNDWFQRLDPQTKTILTRFDFTYSLPKLESVTISDNDNGHFFALSPSEMTAISEQVNKAVGREPTLPRACNIKSLDFWKLSSIPVAAVEFFSQVFPAIEQLLFFPEDKFIPIPIKSAWVHWPDLKGVTVRYGHEYYSLC